MWFRLLAFFHLAVLLALFMFASASSFVSALEQAVGRSGKSEQVAWISVSLLQSECAALHHEIHALSHEITSCGEDPFCLGSPIFCPGALDSNIDREFERLRSELNERCGVSLNLMDYAWGGPVWGERARRSAWASHSTPHPQLGSKQCGAAHDWLESAASGELEATQFFF